MDPLVVDKIRQRVWHSISQDTANQAGPSASGTYITQANLQQFIAHSFMPTDVQLSRLANYLGVKL